MTRLMAAVVAGAMSVTAPADAQLAITLAHDDGAEAATRDELLSLVDSYDVSRWLYTREVIIDRTEIPHSHPVLTLHTRHLGDGDMLLSTFLHEQVHWLEAGEALPAFRAAMQDFRRLYPEVPSRADGGARDEESTYRHLVVCDLELQVMTRLLGESRARDLIASITHYEWVYDKVLNDPRVRDVNTRHGFVLDAL